MLKTIIKVTGYSLASIVFIILLFSVFLHYYNNRERNVHFHQFVGEYKIDLNNTKLEGYNKDSVVYKKLTLKLKPDSTFTFNRKVPFIFDSCGRWSAGSGSVVISIITVCDERSHLYFKGTIYESKLEKYMDSVICIDPMPQKNCEGIQTIYLKKIGR